MRTATVAPTVPRRPMSVWSPLVNKPYEVPKTQKLYDTTAKPTYLKAGSDGAVTAVGLAGLTLVFLRVMGGMVDMALGTNKVEIQ